MTGILGIKVRQASITDISEILPLISEFFKQEGFKAALAKLPSALEAMLHDPGSAIFMAVDGSETIGVATVTTTSLGLEFGRYAELEDLYVVPAARHQGAGKALIEAVKAWCLQTGCNVLSLTITSQDRANETLLDYYRQLGFLESDRLTFVYELETDK